jgi:mRNA interferase RelE/StbE
VADYRLQFTSSAEKELHRLPAAMVTRIASRVDRLAAQPRPPGCKKLRGGVNEWRIRIGDYRVIYTISDAERVIDVTRIAHRKEVYEP